MHEARPADRDDHDVGLAHEAFEIAREAVAAGDRAAGDQQFQRERPADVVGHADHDRMLAAHGSIGVAEQGHHALGRAWAQAEAAQGQAADVHRLEAVDVLVRIDAVDQRVLVDVRGQRRLHQDAVHRRVGIEPVDQREQRVLRGACRQVEIERTEADLLAGLALVAHVDRRGRVLADQHDGEAGLGQALRLALGDATGDAFEQFLRDAFAVEDACAHGCGLR